MPYFSSPSPGASDPSTDAPPHFIYRPWNLVIGLLAVAALVGVLVYATWGKSRPLPQGLKEQRDKLLARADQQIRAGLEDLAKRYPQVRSELDKMNTEGRPGNPGPQSTPGRLFIMAGNRPLDRNRPDDPAPDHFRDTDFNVYIELTSYDAWPPPQEGSPFGVLGVYPNLRIGATGGIWYAAVNPELDRALKHLFNEALSPLAELDAKSGPLKPDHRPGINAYPSTQP